jgi:hypothetical protein
VSALCIIATTIAGAVAGGWIGAYCADGADDLGFGMALYGLAGCATGAVIGASIGAVVFA